MLRKLLNNTKKRKYDKESSGEDGFTLVEVLIAILIIGIITGVLLQGTMVAIRTLKLNKAKTGATAVANEKIELIRAMNYNNIDITSLNPNWMAENPGLLKEGYNIDIDVSWVYGEIDSYKQLAVTVFKEPMNMSVEVVTQLHPGGSVENISAYPPPLNLIIGYDIVEGGNREIQLSWTAPDTGYTVDKYKVYRDSEHIGDALTEMFIDHPGASPTFIFYVTTLYGDGTESVKSNELTTE